MQEAGDGVPIKAEVVGMSADKVFLLIVFMVEILLLAIICLYAIAYLGHSNETAFGDSVFSKLIVWFGMTIGFIPIFLVTLDAGLNNQ